MNSRQRVLAALAHGEPDMVPIDFCATRSTGITAVAYARLMAHLGISGGEIRVYDVGQQLAEVDAAVLERFAVDVVALDADQLGPWQDFRLPDGTPAKIPVACDIVPGADGSQYLRARGRLVRQRPTHGWYFDETYHPLAEASTLADIESYDWQLLDVGLLGRLRERARQLYEETPYAIVGAFGGNVLEAAQSLRGFEQCMLDLAGNKAFASALLQRITEVNLENLRRYLEAVGEYIQVIQFGDDLGMQTGPLISPEAYRQLLKPCHQRLYRYVKDHSSLYVFLHSCGSVYDFIPEFIDAGVDILNPVQTSARNMEPERLKKEFGSDLTFWGGGGDTQWVLPHGSIQEVREDVCQRMAVFAPGGGFVFGQVHNIQPDVPPENVMALFDAAIEHRRYPLL
ncbi:MAG: uroporphyrinogen decarboxylase family protein [Chloroflexota bacterium]